MRRLLAAQSGLAVLFAFSEAPNLHFHADAASEHARETHRGRNMSAHARLSYGAKHHGGHGVEIEAAARHDDDAVFLNWLQTGPNGKAPFVTAQQAFAPVASPDICKQEPAFRPAPRSHDPPRCSPASPRSPPSLPPAV